MTEAKLEPNVICTTILVAACASRAWSGKAALERPRALRAPPDAPRRAQRVATWCPHGLRQPQDSSEGNRTA
eukprot:7810927-Pyramimonas_sp.AAC.1